MKATPTQAWRHPAASVLIVLSVGVIAATSLAACRPGGPGAAVAADPAAAARRATTARLTLAVTPADHSRNQPVSIEIGIALAGGRLIGVSLTRTGSTTPVPGGLRTDGSAWVPAGPLAYATAYTAVVTATGPAGDRSVRVSTTFSTMARPSRLTDTGLYLFDDQVYGVAMPVVVEFDPPVPAAARAGVQRRLFVQTSPAQPGVWSWIGGRQVFYRGPQYWRPGTVITVRAALGGVPTGDGRFGDSDRTATARIGPALLLDVDNASKQMRVYADGKLLRRLPVSLGKPSTPSSSGRLVVMSKEYTTTFDTTREGPGGYRVTVNYAMRLTWGGEFIHAAPWSVADQGHRNVSHGCVNLSWDNAAWLFHIAHVGDPVLVRGTEVHVTPGNGWTVWDQPWSQFVQGSALPVPADLAAAPAVDPPPGR
jgi:lipoprotein-anchoring transpeptidase ErfK/SrfK